MIIIHDVSQKVLGDTLNTERKYMSIMNSTTSHEMRNPLNSISSNIDNQLVYTSQLKDLLSTFDMTSEQKELLNPIMEKYSKSLKISKSSCSLMLFNVEDLLALPQLKQGKLPKHITTVDIKEALDEVADIMDYMLQIKNIGLEI